MKQLTNRTQALLIVVLAAFVVLPLAPGEKKFPYDFKEGKPWQYDLLTAPYVIPKLKSTTQLAHEENEVKASVLPYYRMERSIGQSILQSWEDDFNAQFSDSIPIGYYNHVRSFLRRAYFENGVVDDSERDQIVEKAFDEINLIDGDVSRAYPVVRLYSINDAYSDLINRTPDELNKEVVRRISPIGRLKANVMPDNVTTQRVIATELSKIPRNTGYVDKGERIIGRGDKVDAETYNILESYKKIYESQTGLGSTVVLRKLGLFFLSLMLFMGVWLFCYNFRPAFFDNTKNTLFVVSFMLIFVLITQIVVKVYPRAVYAIPFAVVPIVVRPFFHSRLAFFIHLITVLVSSIFVPDVLEFFFLQLTAGMVAIFSLKTLNSRGQLIRTAFLVFLSYIVVSLLLSLTQTGSVGFKEAFDQLVYTGERIDNEFLQKMLYFAFNLIFLMFSYMLIYPVEKAFGYVSNVSLVELSDVNRPLLRQLSETAPGTFQHSMQVSTLASEAAARIGADVQLVRTGALYHDIGKMLNPSYFTENQGEAGNPHNSLSYKESAAIIIKHVTDGYMLAQKYRLPREVTNMILSHHGKGQVKYFYRLYSQEHPDEYVDPAPFTYPGPNPKTSEEGILMLADCTEAASRSLKVYTDETISSLVNGIVDSVLNEGLLNETPLTFKNITDIKEVFIEKLKTIYHSRIAYPKAPKEKTETSK